MTDEEQFNKDLELHRRQLIQDLKPDMMLLHRIMRPQISEKILRLIARADYGMDQKENYEALLDLVESDPLPREFIGCPHDVLQLTNFNQGEGTQDLSRNEFHVMRAFSCYTRLCTDQCLSKNVVLIPLLESVLLLNNRPISAAISFLAFLMEDQLSALDGIDDEERPFFPLAIVILAVAGDYSSDLVMSAAALLEKEAEVVIQLDELNACERRREIRDEDYNRRWLFSYGVWDLYFRRWLWVIRYVWEECTNPQLASVLTKIESRLRG